VYVRDPLVTVPGGAIVGRMAVLMRRGEEADLTRVVAAAGMPVLATMTGTATLEGGSFVKLRDGVAALGTSIRCNDEAAGALREVLARIGWELVVVPLPGYTIHLDMHMAMLDVDLALADVTGLPYTFLTRLQEMGIGLVRAQPGETWGLNLLGLSPRRVLMAEGSPETAARLRAAGVEVRTIPYDEVHRNGGGVHCSTMELVRDPA
jgi:N-dimethylarginine dimethylaminohydrolase